MIDAVLVLPLTGEQLAMAEEKGTGYDLRLMLDANGPLGYDLARANGNQNNLWSARLFNMTDTALSSISILETGQRSATAQSRTSL